MGKYTIPSFLWEKKYTIPKFMVEDLSCENEIPTWISRAKAIESFLAKRGASESFIKEVQDKDILENGGPDLHGQVGPQNKSDYLYPDKLGEIIDTSGPKMNRILEGNGMQERTITPHCSWAPTEKGKDYCIKIIEYGDREDPPHTLKWLPSVLDLLECWKGGL